MYESAGSLMWNVGGWGGVQMGLEHIFVLRREGSNLDVHDGAWHTQMHKAGHVQITQRES